MAPLSEVSPRRRAVSPRPHRRTLSGNSTGSTEVETARQTARQPNDERKIRKPVSKQHFPVLKEHQVVFTPLVTMICVALLVWEFSANGWQMQPLKENPSVGPSLETLIACGAKETSLILDGETWRLFSAMFLHAGIVHILLNMLGFLNIGYTLEYVYGPLKLATIYLMSGLYGTIVSAVFLPEIVMVGASGAILGVFGALWADILNNWGVYINTKKAILILLVLTSANVILGFMPYLDNFAHLGGMVMGFCVGLALLVHKREDVTGKAVACPKYHYITRLFGAVAAVGLFVITLMALYAKDFDINEKCGWCMSLSCIPFPPGDNPWWQCDECHSVGFYVSYFGNGTVIMSCPDATEVVTDICQGTDLDSLTSCCQVVCL
ncbi:unnamed protein product [Chrysoparadoxa australica]